MLFVDGGEDRVGIGTDSPAEKLEVQSASNTTIRIDNADDSTAKVLFHNTGSTDRQIAVTSGAMTFGGTSAEFARIDDDGRLLVNTSSTSSTNRVVVQGATSGSAGKLAIARNNNTPGSTDTLSALTFATSLHETVAQIQCARDSGTWTASSSYPTNLKFYTTADGASSSNEKMRIFSTGQAHHFSTNNGMFVGSSLGAGTTNWLYRGNRNRTNNTSGGTTVFYVYTNGNVENTNSSYGAISDVKLKENIVDANSQWDDLKRIQVRKYNFKEETGHETHTQLWSYCPRG